MRKILAIFSILLLQVACVNTSTPPATQKVAQTQAQIPKQTQSQSLSNKSNTALTEAVEQSQGKVMVVGIKGQISKNALEKLKQSLGQVTGDPIPAGLIVLLDSLGGDGVAAMQMGRLLRKANAHVFVTGQCASACIFVLASGVVRVAPSYSVGIHRGRVTMSDANAKIIKEVDINENPQAKAALQHFESQAPLYFAEMGMSPELFPFMQSHQLKGVYRLSSAEIAKTKLSGFETAYLQQRTAFYRNQTGPYRMDEDEFMSRTQKVASRCSGFEKQHTEFIRCYKQTLREPFLN
ncbi:hypothetical protein PKF023_11440 [Polynucleobacter yangtzensis]|uniref:Uncharacterized protein n=1 Tax=Polynucleobacter yangtzensis TaxID=1743159 RepID=A0A9C7FI97_9BURK|nr:hypothetical protein [Polynucleobacter yangtzensis]BDT77341.1 hypothetical protein PKF023_11440 [Polynucleobacter yangtzensis]